MTKEYQICSRCVMDTSDEDIVFDNSGSCNHCENHFTVSSRFGYTNGDSEAKLDRLVLQIKHESRDRPYDCVVGVSGGVDSSYVALLCKDLGLRALLVHFDNGWNSEVAVQNISRLVRSLGFDYITDVVDWPSFRDIQLSILKSGSVDLELPTDVAIFTTVMEAARKNKVKYIFSGTNLSSEGMLPLTWGYHRYKDIKYYRSLIEPKVRESIKRIPHYSLVREGFYRLVYRFRTVSLLNYVPYNKERAKQELSARLGWSDYGGKHMESRITAFWQGYAMNRKFGFDYRRPTLSAEICSGIVSREHALRILSQDPLKGHDYASLNAYVAKKLGISVEELDVYLNSPVKSYKDFPNSKKLIDFFNGIYKSFLSPLL